MPSPPPQPLALHSLADFCHVPVGYWEEEHSYSRRSWERYQREVLHELGCRDGDNDEEEEEDDDGDKYNSD